MRLNNRIIVEKNGVIAENTDGVANFTEDTLSIRLGGDIISISGEALVIVSMDEGTVTVSGKIRSVNLL